jgi:hypothetical protein
MISYLGFSQNTGHVEAVLGLYPSKFENATQLANYINRDFKTEEEKVRAIYSWIIQHIAYQPEAYKLFDYRFKNYRERNQKEEKTRHKIIKHTLKNGEAVCEGYAFLFEKLCTLTGIRNYLVRGDTKATFNDIGKPFSKNHMWNIAFINKKPYLFDPTWGAGKYTSKFIKDTSYFYYKTPPLQFIKTHYPDMIEDALLSKPFSKETFSNLPLIISKELNIDDIITPVKGIIYTQKFRQSIPFKIKNNTINNVYFSYDGKEKTAVKHNMVQDQLMFEIPVALGVKNLLIYFNEKPALGYVIK